MNLASWVKDKALSVVKHHSPGGDLDKAEREVKEARPFRLESFEKIAKPVLIATTIMVGFGAVTQTYANPQVVDSVQSQAHQEIRDEMSPGYTQFQDLAGSSSLTIVDKNDPNLENIIGATHVDLLPTIGQFSWMTNDQGAPMTPPLDAQADSIKDYIYQSMNSMDDNLAVAFVTNKTTNVGNLCVVQANYSEKVNVDARLYVDFADAEAKLSVAAHELAHCQDVEAMDFSDIAAYRHAEALADMTAALVIASKTGNWDYLDYTETAYRVTSPQNITHYNVPIYEQMKKMVDLDGIQPLTQKEAFEMANDLLDKMDLDSLNHQAYMDLHLKLGYNAATFHGKSLSDLGKEEQAFFKEELGVENQEQFMAAVEGYGEQKLEVYLDHVNYKSLESDALISKGFARHFSKHGKTFDNQEMVDYGMDLFKGNIGDNSQSMNVSEIATKFGFDIDFASKGRFESNQEKVSDLYNSYKPKAEVSYRVQMEGIQNATGELSVNEGSKQAFLDRAGIEETPKKHNHFEIS